MSMNNRTSEELSKRLGLPSQKIHMELFTERHQLKPGSTLAEAIYWAPNQKAFLIEATEVDS